MQRHRDTTVAGVSYDVTRTVPTNPALCAGCKSFVSEGWGLWSGSVQACFLCDGCAGWREES